MHQKMSRVHSPQDSRETSKAVDISQQVASPFFRERKLSAASKNKMMMEKMQSKIAVLNDGDSRDQIKSQCIKQGD